MRTFLRRSLELQQRVASAFALPRDTLPRWVFLLATLAIVLAGMALRAAYLLTHDPDPAYLWKGQLILTSADGFYFATGVGHALTDAWGSSPRVPPADLHALVALTAGLAKLTGLSLEALFTWLPVVLGPLLAVPLALLGRLSGRSLLGLLAGLFAVASPTYAIRTGVGYFDTDVFTVTVPLLAAVLLARALSPEPARALDPPEAVSRLRARAGAVGALVLSTYIFFYDQGIAIAQLMGLITAIGLALYPWLTRLGPALGPPLPVATSATLASATAFANLPVYWPFRTLTTLASLLALPRLPLGPKLRIGIAALATVGVFLGGEAAEKLMRKVEIYTENQNPEAAPLTSNATPNTTPRGDSAQWKAQDTTGLVAEAKVLPFSAMAKRTTGHPLIFVVGLLGALLLFVSRASLAPLVPLLGVGLFAFFGGHRFLIYLVPFVGLGLAFLALHAGRLLARLAPTRPAVAASGAVAFVLAGTVPSALQASQALPTPAMIVPEIEALEALDRLSQPSDVTIAWWDFGYPIAYYGHTRTITDGSLRGDDAALAAEILLTDSVDLARKLSLLAVDALDHSSADGAAAHLFGAAKEAGLGPIDFLAAVRAGRWPIPDPPHDVYLYLPLRIVPIIQALEVYRPSGLHEQRKAPFTRLYRGVRSEAGKLLLGDGLEVESDTVAMWRTNARGQREKKALHSIHVISGSGPTATKRSRPGDPRADTAGVLLRDLHVFIELEPRLLASVWASLFLFDSADPQAFELVFANDAAKIYRVRRPAPATRAPVP